jgi:outer membrane protein TolC
MASLEQSQQRTAARVAAGREAAFATRRFEDRVLSTRDGLIGARERYLLVLDRFKVRLGLSVDSKIVIVPTELVIPEPEIAPSKAMELALEYRLDLQTRRDRLDDSRRAVSNAKNQILPDLDLTAGLSTATNPAKQTSNFDFDFGSTGYNASITFGLPLDREIERLNLRSSMISMERAIRAYDLFRDNIIVESRAAVRNIDQNRFSVDLAERRVAINTLVIEQLKLQEADSLQITDAEDQRLQSENFRDARIRDLRVAVLNYLLSTGTMRVDREGQFVPSPGMGEIEVRTSKVPGVDEDEAENDAPGPP